MFFFVKIILTSLHLVEGLAWWDWPFTWWTDQLLSFKLDTVGWVIWPVKIVPDMTYDVFGGTLNPTPLLLYWNKTVTAADCILYNGVLSVDPEDLISTHAATDDTASCGSNQSPMSTTRHKNKIVVRRARSIAPPSKMRTSESMPKVSY